MIKINIIQKLTLKLTKKNRMDLTEGFRIKAVLPFIKGKLLDIGCGYNNLVKSYPGEGVGVDIFNWGGGGAVDYVVERSDTLPFENETFDTITFLACLNHIPYHVTVLNEANRLLKKEGSIIVTMISPWIGKLIHLIESKDESIRGKIDKEEKHGLNTNELERLFNGADLTVTKMKSFEFGLNTIYILRKQKGEAII